MLVTKQLMVDIDFHMENKILWKSMATVSCLVNYILQNILLWMNYPFKFSWSFDILRIAHSIHVVIH